MAPKRTDVTAGPAAAGSQHSQAGPPQAGGPDNQVAHCGATTADGRPCPLRPLRGSDRCFQHSEDPAVVEQRAVARRLGGLNATRQRYLSEGTVPPVLENPAGIRAVLADTIQQVRTGQLPPAAANSVVYAVSTALKLAEMELSAQVAELEQALLERGRKA
jgi:hypothetical protein